MRSWPLAATLLILTGCQQPQGNVSSSPKCGCDNEAIRAIVDKAIAEHESTKAAALPADATTILAAVKPLVDRVNYATYWKELEQGLVFSLDQRSGFQVQASCGVGLPCILELTDAKNVLGGVELDFDMINPNYVVLSNAKVNVCKADYSTAAAIKNDGEASPEFRFGTYVVHGQDNPYHYLLTCRSQSPGSKSFTLTETFPPGRTTKFKVVYPGNLFEFSTSFGIHFESSQIVSRK